MEQFWTCWVEGTSGGLHHPHLTLGEARQEAERLARQPANRGKKVYITRAVAYCEIPETPIEWHGRWE